jgi:hypothetical protein
MHGVGFTMKFFLYQSLPRGQVVMPCRERPVSHIRLRFKRLLFLLHGLHGLHCLHDFDHFEMSFQPMTSLARILRLRLSVTVDTMPKTHTKDNHILDQENNLG